MRRRLRKAAQVVEFALLFPVFLVMLAALADYGWFLSQHVGVTQAARDAARAGALAWGDQDPTLLAQAAAEATLDSWNIQGGQLDTTYVLDPDLGQLIEVSITVPFEPLLNLVPAPEHLDQTVIMRTEIQPDPNS